jgi:hypothetical protein
MFKTKQHQADAAARLEAFREDERPEVPNLDGFSTEVEDYDALVLLYMRLMQYAGWKADAMRLRAAGDIPAALEYERLADSTYRKLPDWAKW